MRGDDEAAHLAKAILRFRRHRTAVLPVELFSEPAWELMLELFVSDAEGTQLTARQVADRAGVPHAVMARWLKHLSVYGLVVGAGDGDLDDPLSLSGSGMENMEQLLGHASSLKNEFTVPRSAHR